MADNLDAQMSEFKALSQAVDEGQLYLSSEAADQAAKACQDRIDWLQEFKNSSHNLMHVASFGNFGSAQALGNKFQGIANGEGGFEDVIQSHIDVVKQMKEVFEKADKAYAATDEATRDALGTINPQP